MAGEPDEVPAPRRRARSHDDSDLFLGSLGVFAARRCRRQCISPSLFNACGARLFGPPL